MDLNSAVVAVLAWLAAASITRAITTDSIFAPWREVRKVRYNERANSLREQIHAMPPDHPRRWSKARRYEWLVASGGFFSCPWCVGFWVYLAVAAVAWLALGTPDVIWGGSAWFTVPAAALAGRWLYGVMVPLVDPPHSDPVVVQNR